MLSPVHRGWQGLLRRLGIGLGQHPWVRSLHPAQVESPELLPGEIEELGHPGAVAGLGLGQLQLLQVGDEDLEAGFKIRRIKECVFLNYVSTIRLHSKY